MRSRWPMVRLGDVAHVRSGNTPSKSNPDYWGGVFPWVTARDMKTPVVKSTGITLTEAGFAQASVAPAGAVLILTRGMTLFKNVPVCLAGVDVAFNQDVKALVPTGDADPAYLAQYLTAQKSRLLSIVDAAGHGTGRLDTYSLMDVDIALPPLDEQRRIAEILNTWDEAIAKTERLICRKQTIHRALVDRYTNPMSGTSGRVIDFARERRLRAPEFNLPPVLSVSNRRGLVIPEQHFSRPIASENLSAYKIIERGEFAYNPSRLNVGSIARLDDRDAGLLSPMYVVFTVDDSLVNSDYFLHWLDSTRARASISNSAQGSVRDSVGFSDFAAIPIRLPTRSEQDIAAEVLNDSSRELVLTVELTSAYRRQREGLMQQLFGDSDGTAW